MSTRGWSLVPAPPRPKRPTLAQQCIAAHEARTEAELQRQVNALLEQLVALGQIAAWVHIPDGARGKRAERPGAPDMVLALPQGRGMRGIELKSSTGRVSPEQAIWLEGLGEHGAVCRSLDEVRAVLRGWGVQA